MVHAAENSMGKIITTLTVTNRFDEALATNHYITASQVRSITLNNVLVDSGATTLCLPADIIATLGLELLKEVEVETARGISRARVFQDAKISCLGREGTFECLELPAGRNPLLGVIPLEALGLELDLQRQKLRLLPIGPSETYLTILCT
ncbi:aspartyl protease [Leptolyngbya sp. 'hensonii']|uniref:aspartyl protease n=1 Tax=Leptolyngbya sp. 'hensonii' TaxID=1922337 RepID=UPI00094FE0FC|nr:aspartyl protease [Leptolyngbya sp. 'hensonii']OLP17664.1 aspartyl protease [Leptolyngbya sp. 'hensonii']